MQNQRNVIMAVVLTGLLLIGFSALFIGGLGVFNSVHAYLQGKLGTLATLRVLGLRDAREWKPQEGGNGYRDEQGALWQMLDIPGLLEQAEFLQIGG